LDRTACAECDLIVTIGSLVGGQQAVCPRCGHVITSVTDDALNRAFALAMAALMLLVMANTFPFLEIEAKGLRQVMTLPHSAVELYDDGYGALSFFVMAPTVIIPGLMLVTMLALIIPLRRGRPAPWLVPAGRVLFAMNNWSMVEVFVIGVLVSLVKLTAYVSVVIGLSFWAYVGFSVCFIAAVSSLDRFQLWRRIEACVA
jgi:paraquat-inducible protein A